MNPAVCLLAVVLIAGYATENALQRYAWDTGLKPDEGDGRRQAHANLWSSVNRAIKACYIKNTCIQERETDGGHRRFADLDYSGKGFGADTKQVTADPETQRWRKETDPCRPPLLDAAAKGKIWSDTMELWFLN